MKYLLFLLLIPATAYAQQPTETPGKFLVGNPVFWKSLCFWANKDSVITLTFKFPISGRDTISGNNKIELHLKTGEVLHFTHTGKDNFGTDTYSHLIAVIKLSENDIKKILASTVETVSFEAKYQTTRMYIPESMSRLINEALDKLNGE